MCVAKIYGIVVIQRAPRAGAFGSRSGAFELGDLEYEVCTSPSGGRAAMGMDADTLPFNALVRNLFDYPQFYHTVLRTRVVLQHNAPDLITVARDREHDDVAALLEKTLIEQRGASAETHEIHVAAGAGDLDQVSVLVEKDVSLVHRGDPAGRTPLHHAVREGHPSMATYLLNQGADVDAANAKGNTFYAVSGYRPINLAMEIQRPPIRWAMMGLLLGRGAAYTITVAAKLGDTGRVKELLTENPDLANDQEPNGVRPIGAAAFEDNMALVELLLEHGADPLLEEGRDAPRGSALWRASFQDNYEMAELLLKHGADPNGFLESAGSPMSQSKTPAMRTLMYSHGGVMSLHGYIADGGYWPLDAVASGITMGKPAEQELANMFTHVVNARNWELLRLMLARGLRVPPVVTGCQEYLWRHTDMARTLLEHQMDPNLPNWQRMTPLHHIAGRTWHNKTKEAWTDLVDLFLEFGANINAIDEEFRSTPLGWAARLGKDEMVAYLLEKGADPDGADEAWATPLTWAKKRGHKEITKMLKKYGAKA